MANIIQLNNGRVTKGKNLAQWIDDLFDDGLEDEGIEKVLYPHFDVRVGVPLCMPPRDDFFEYILDMGRTNIDCVMKAEKIDPNPFFCLPERWLSVQEGRYFMAALNQNPNRNKLGVVRILTQSPILIGEFPRNCIRMFRLNGDENYHTPYLQLFWGQSVSGLEE